MKKLNLKYCLSTGAILLSNLSNALIPNEAKLSPYEEK